MGFENLPPYLPPFPKTMLFWGGSGLALISGDINKVLPLWATRKTLGRYLVQRPPLEDQHIRVGQRRVAI